MAPELDLSNEESNAIHRWVGDKITKGEAKELDIVKSGTNNGPIYIVEDEPIIFMMRPGPAFTFPGPSRIITSKKVLEELEEAGIVISSKEGQ